MLRWLSQLWLRLTKGFRQRVSGRLRPSSVTFRVPSMGDVRLDVLPSERAIIKELLLEIRFRRALYDPIAKENVSKMLRSLGEMRGVLMEAAAKLLRQSDSLGPSAELILHIQDIIGGFLSQWEDKWTCFISQSLGRDETELRNEISLFRSFPDNYQLEKDIFRMRKEVVDSLGSLATLVGIDLRTADLLRVYLTDPTVPRHPPISVPTKVRRPPNQ